MNPPGSPSVSRGPVVRPVASSMAARVSIGAPCVAVENTAPVLAQSEGDPQKVITPLDTDGLEAVLQERGLLTEWSARFNPTSNKVLHNSSI